MHENFFATLMRAIAVTFKRLYDLIASYVLFWVLWFSSAAVAFHVGLDLLGAQMDTDPALWWDSIAAAVGISPNAARLLVFTLAHIVVYFLVRRPLEALQPRIENAIRWVAGIFDRLTTDRLSLKLFGEAVFSLVVTALLLPFLLQPTLVPDLEGVEPWAERAANLVDGTASIALMESVVGLYRLGFAEPVVAQQGVTADELDDIGREEPQTVQGSVLIYGPPNAATGYLEMPAPVTIEVKAPTPTRPQPVMDRWDEVILTAVNDDLDRFSYVKAFMYVESAGRQYAVSRTGCAGLMQFCSGTARSNPFRRVFGTGQVYTCGCRNGCSIDREVRVALESGDRELVEAQADEFPCQLTDARFDPSKAVAAGALYVDRLHRQFGGNIQIMYIGYNSGPAVAKRVWRAVGENPDATLAEIEEALPGALRPYYGKSANVRARSLVEVHLPKIQRAQLRYAAQPQAQLSLEEDATVAASSMETESSSLKSNSTSEGVLVPSGMKSGKL